MKVYRTLIVRDRRDRIIDTIDLDDDCQPTARQIRAVLISRAGDGARSAQVIESQEKRPS